MLARSISKSYNNIGGKLMKEDGRKYRCKVCGQVVKPAPDGSCPLCFAPKSMLTQIRDADDDDNDLKK